jgi:OPA family glycerol-3-phosphate transporter-like MFS transporter
VKEIYLSLTLMIVLQTLNGWFNGMGWAPCGKTMVHWFSTKERGRAVSIWNVAHNVGGALVATIHSVVTFYDLTGAFSVAVPGGIYRNSFLGVRQRN